MIIFQHFLDIGVFLVVKLNSVPAAISLFKYVVVNFPQHEYQNAAARGMMTQLLHHQANSLIQEHRYLRDRNIICIINNQK
jgi:hypothetical protein